MTHPTADLRRVVSRWQIVGLALNDVIGSGVYLLPAAAAAFLGPWSIWAVLLAGLAVSLLVLCFAEASAISTSRAAPICTRARPSVTSSPPRWAG